MDMTGRWISPRFRRPLITFEKLDTDGALRPTIVNIGDNWTKLYFKNLRGEKRTDDKFGLEKQKEEKKRCFDLLDALSRSGALPMDEVSLHVMVAATHCFDDTVIDTVVQRSINPIEKVERSELIVGATIYGRTPMELVSEDRRAEIEGHSPQLNTSINKD